MSRPEAGGRGARAVRVLLLDDHPIVRDGLARYLGGQSGLEVAGALADADALWR